MIRSETLHSSAPNKNSSAVVLFNYTSFYKSGLRIVMFAGLAAFCVMIFSSFALAEPKTKRSSAKTNSRSRSAADKHRSSSKNSVADKRNAASKRSTASKRTTADKKRSSLMIASKLDSRRNRGRATVQQIARVREVAAKQPVVSNVKPISIVTPKQPDNVAAIRPTLVNDIVIISEAPPGRTMDRLSPLTRGTGSSDNMPSIWPVAGAIRGGFGVRHNPFSGRGSEFHKGQDISAPYGSQVIATADGVVVISGWLRGYGNVVYVDHGNGISTRYGHLSRIDVLVGQVIKRGDNLGLVGSTGRSTGPHLHYEVRLDGLATNPIPYLPNIPAPLATTPATR